MSGDGGSARLTVREGGVLETIEAMRSTVSGDEKPRPRPRPGSEENTGLVLVVGDADRLTDRLAVAGAATGVTVRSIEEWALERVATAQGRETRVLSPVVRRRAVRTALLSADDGPLARLADRVAAETDPVAAEFEDYLRCTDAGNEADHEALLGAVESVAPDRPFAAEVTRESVEAFRELDGRLREAVTENDATGRVFVSRSHLLRAVRGLDVAEDWVVVVPRRAIDAGVLRTAVATARGTPVTLVAGSADNRLADRADAVAEEAGVPTRHETGGSPESVAARRTLAAARNRPTTAPEGVRTVAVPDRRREVEYAVEGASGTDGRALLVAPDPDAYASAVRDVSLTADRPYRVGSARRVGTLPAARTLRATVSLLAGDDVAAETVIASLRRGAIAPSADSDARRFLPLPAVDRLREELPDSAPLETHRDRVASAAADHPGDELDGAVALLDWATAVAGTPPEDGAALQERLVSVLDAHAQGLRERPFRRVTGLAVETDRARAAAEHPAGAAARVRAAVEDHAAAAYDHLTGGESGDQEWEAGLLALQAALSSERSPPATDADALELLSIADPAAAVAGVDHLFVLGLSAERFPRTPPRPVLVHRAVREAVARGAAGPAAHLDSETAWYRHDIEALGRVLRGVRPGGRVTLVRPYKDDDGRDVPPSPFLDALSVPDDQRDSVDLGEWVPGPDRTPPTPKDRLRTLAHHAGTSSDSEGDRRRLERLADGVAPDDARRLLRRVERFDDRTADESEDRSRERGERGG